MGIDFGVFQAAMPQKLRHRDHSMVTRWETGKVLPRPDTIEKLAEALGTTVDELTHSSSEEPLKISGPVEDADLLQLLTQVHLLEEREREALKVVLEGVLTRSRIKDFMHPGGVRKQAS